MGFLSEALERVAPSATVVELQWPASSGATSYLVERLGPGESGFTQIASNVAGTGYRDTGRLPQTTYAYRVRAQNAAGRSGYGPTAEITEEHRANRSPSAKSSACLARQHDWRRQARNRAPG